MSVATLEEVAALARACGLAVLGALHPGAEDGAPAGCGTLVLLGPDGPGFWRVFRESAEFGDGVGDPLDRWSERVIGGLARELDARAVFPFGGPPWAPFTAWARRSGEAWVSPVGLLVHARAGLFVSYRGALALGERLALPAAGARPCEACAQAVPRCVPGGGADGAGYDLAACHGFLDTAAGRDCLGRGCAVRRACPVGRGRGRRRNRASTWRPFMAVHSPCGG